MAFMAVLESDLRSLSAEARRRYPSIKDGAEHAILKIRSLSMPSEIAHNEDILKIFLMACEVKSVKLSVIALSSLQKLISHDAVVPSALRRILPILNEHAEMLDESIQLKTLQTILIIFQSHLHPENEEDMAQALAIPLRLLESFRSSDNVRSTAAATFRQAIALIFDHMVSAECLPSKKPASEVYSYRSASNTGDIICNTDNKESIKSEYVKRPLLLQNARTESGKLGLLLLEDIAALAAGGYARWLHVSSFQRTFALDILEFILSNFAVVFIRLDSFQQVLRGQICSLLMTSLRVNIELEGEVGEPAFRRLVLRSVAHIVKLYSTPLITECEVFVSMLIKVTMHDVPLWHHILVLEVLRGFCVDARTLQILYENFDMHPDNTNVVEEMVKALAMVVSTLQVDEASEESLAAVTGMFSSKAKGVEWSLENDTSNAAVIVASEAHAVTLAIEGLLGVVFTIATLTNEALDTRELDSPRCGPDRPIKCTGRIALLCTSMVNSLWLTILHALSLILARSQGEAIVVEILKGYQSFTQACGILRIEEPLNSYLASLCKFAISIQLDPDRSVLQSPRSNRSEFSVDQRDSIVLTPKNVQALRTLFNIAHRLHNVLGPSWVLVLETLAALDRIIHSPAVTFKDSSALSPKLMRESSGHYSDFTILSSLNSQLFESSSCMHISAVNSLVSALSQLTAEGSPGARSSSSTGLSNQKFGSFRFCVERMLSILMNNLHRAGLLWDKIAEYFIELANNSDQHARVMALDGLDRAICGVLASNHFERLATTRDNLDNETTNCNTWERSFEFAVISSLRVLYFTNQYADIRTGSLKILQHVLERYREKLLYVWPNILEMLRYVADASDKELITMGFQTLRVVMNDGLSIIPAECLNTYIDVTGAYSAQKTELNVSLTAIGLLWTTTDFIAKNFPGTIQREAGHHDHSSNHVQDKSLWLGMVGHDKLFFSVFELLKNLSKDERPEVRNSAIRTFFQSFCSHGQKLSESLLVDCFWSYVFHMLEQASHMAATSSKDEWQGKELGIRGGKTIHMLIHHSRNTVQKQWDETLVLILGGISRIFRSFFPALGSTENFSSGWKDLLVYLQSSILNGSKEVAMAAVNCLQTTVISNSLKGTLSMPYLESILEIYHLVLQSSHNYASNIPAKVKEEILRCLGELYVHAHAMFDAALYKKLLAIVHISAKETMAMNTTETDTENLQSQEVPSMQRAILEMFPLLRPTASLSSMWCFFLHELLLYLPHAESSSEHQQVAYNSSAGVRDSKWNSIFVDQLVPVILDLFVHAPISDKRIIFPDVVQGLGRCMMTRRECPDGDLWRLAVGCFNRVVVDELKNVPDDHEHSAPGKSSRLRMWKEIADVFEQFLTGYCGRALPSNSLPPEADEALEMDVLNVLTEEILKSRIDAPSDILQRLVLTLDRCASRTCSLPLETVELIPPHCSRFSLTCLRKLFSLSSHLNEVDDERTETTGTEIVGKISVAILIDRCEHVLNRYLIDESVLGERPFPAARFDEVVCVLQELASLVIPPETATVLPLHPNLRTRVGDDKYPSSRRPHLLVMYPSICDLVTSRQDTVREMVQALLRLVGAELALKKMSSN